MTAATGDEDDGAVPNSRNDDNEACSKGETVTGDEDDAVPNSGNDDNEACSKRENVSEEDRKAHELLSRMQTRWVELKKGNDGAVQRPNAETKAMPFWSRLKTRMKGYMKIGGGRTPSSQQYRIPPANAEHVWGAFWKRRARREKKLMSLASSHVLVIYFLVVYFVVISLFALVLQAFVRVYYNAGQECVTNYDYSNAVLIDPTSSDNFLVLFGLSWTTFSTVGYGIIGISTEDGCQGIRYILAIEAFVGVMYSGFSGALIFSNISGFLARAHVTFSSSICLQYGSGLTGPRITYHKSGKERFQDNTGEATPGHCPIIEMRLINDRVGKGASISDAYLQCLVVVSEDVSAADESSSKDMMGEDRLTFRLNDGVDSQEIGDAKVETCEELKISPNSLPYFSHGSWYFQHILNENSVLLKETVRDRIRDNGGNWPDDLNEYSQIRGCFSDRVDYIAVVMKGTSTLTAGDIFKTVKYNMEDIYIGYSFAEIGYITSPDKNLDLSHCVQFDFKLANDIKPQFGGGNEPLGNRFHLDVSEVSATSRVTDTNGADMVDRHYLWRDGHRRNYDRLVRPLGATRGMNWSRRRWAELSIKIRHCFRRNSNADEEEESKQYMIPTRDKKRFVDYLLPGRPVISMTLWLYQTSVFNALLLFLLGYFVLVWLFALLIYGVDPSCLSGWDDAPGGFVQSFYVPFQVSWCTFSTVGFGGVAPIAGEPCRGLNVVLAAEALLGVIYNSYCGAIFYAKLSRNESIANVSFSSPVCIQYAGDGATEKEQNDVTPASSTKDDRPVDGPDFPFLEMRLLNEDAQFGDMKGEILNSSIKCFATSFEVKLADDDASKHDSTNDAEDRAERHSFDDLVAGIRWKRICDEIKIVPCRQVVFTKAPWSFRHVLDGTSPLLKPTVRRRINELGSWPADLNDYEKVRGCLAPELNALHVLFKGTANRTANPVFQVHEYKPEDIFVGWRFAGLGYVEETKDKGDGTKYEVKFDRCLLNDIIPLKGGKAEPIHGASKDESDVE